MAKLWVGRFKKELDQTVNDFNSSISFDGRMFRQDIRGSKRYGRRWPNWERPKNKM